MSTIPVWIAWLKFLSFVYYGYNLLLKVEYSGRTLYDCAGLTLPNPASNPLCTVVPPGGLQEKLHLQVPSNFSDWAPATAEGSNQGKSV